MPLPNFFIVGAAKSGTTSLYHYLKQHPAIFMSSIKEPNHFLFCDEEKELKEWMAIGNTMIQRIRQNSITDIDEYASLFDKVKLEKVIGEASARYLYHKTTAGHIHSLNPDAKIISLLRNPFDAAYSEYLMHRRSNVISNPSFLKVLQSEDMNNTNPWGFPFIIKRRFYDIQIERYLVKFPKEQLNINLYEDFENPELLLQNIFQFLGVKDDYRPDTSLQYNIGIKRTEKSLFNSIINRIPQVFRIELSQVLPAKTYRAYMGLRLGGFEENNATSKCPQRAKEYLVPIFKPHILRLQDMIDRDLSSWLT